MSGSVPIYTAIDANKIAFSNALTNKNGGKYVIVSHDGNRLSLQLGVDETDLMHSAFGISTEYSKDDGTKFSLDLDVDEAKKTFIQQLDNLMITSAIASSPDLFKRQTDEASIRSMHTSVIKVASKPEYSDRIRIKIATTSHEATRIFVGQMNDGTLLYRPGSIADIVKNCKVLPVVKASIWFMTHNRMWGMSLRIIFNIRDS